MGYGVLLSLDESEGRYSDPTAAPWPSYPGNEEARGALVKESYHSCMCGNTHTGSGGAKALNYICVCDSAHTTILLFLTLTPSKKF